MLWGLPVYRGSLGKVARGIADHYSLPQIQKILDIGCGKGYLLYDFLKAIPNAEIYGIDISDYAISNSKPEIRDCLVKGNATMLPWPDQYFDLVISINTLHNLYIYDLDKALREMQRVGKNYKYLCVESYQSERQKANLLYWQVTCEAFLRLQSGYGCLIKLSTMEIIHSYSLIKVLSIVIASIAFL